MFLAGDAVHLVIPTGGLGMNSGVGDAIDLGWKLEATLKGWGGPNLLASYEFERRQIGDRNVGASRYASLGRRKWRSMWRPNIRDDTPEGTANPRRSGHDRRRRAAQVERDDRRRTRLSLCRFAAHLRYPGRTRAPVSSTYVPTTWPGARLPHVWLDDGTRHAGPHSDRGLQDPAAWQGETRRRSSLATDSFGAPVTELDIPDQVAREVYGFDLILLRPDMHIVWRGNARPTMRRRLPASPRDIDLRD